MRYDAPTIGERHFRGWHQKIFKTFVLLRKHNLPLPLYKQQWDFRSPLRFLRKILCFIKTNFLNLVFTFCKLIFNSQYCHIPITSFNSLNRINSTLLGSNLFVIKITTVYVCLFCFNLNILAIVKINQENSYNTPYLMMLN